MRTCLAAAAILVACGGGNTKSGPPITGPVHVANACNGTNPVACYESKRSQCIAGKVWKIDMSRLGELTVASSGALRMELAGATMFGHGGERWLACTKCMDAPVKKLCMPYEFPVRLRGSYDASCKRQVTDAPPWNRRASKLLTITCGETGAQKVFRLRYVPSLRPVGDALVAAGVIKEGGELHKINGLIVETYMGKRSLLRLNSIELSDCTTFMYPGSIQKVTAPDRFNELDSLMPPLRRSFSKAGRSMVDLMLAEAVRRATLQVGRECLGPNVAIEHTAVEACLSKRPLLKKKFRDVVVAAAAKLATKQQGTVEKLMRSHLVWPLCRHYAGKLRTP